MQTIQTYIRANSTRGTLVDAYNNQTSQTPTLTLCLNAALGISLFKNAESEKYSQAELNAYTWKWYAHNGYGAQSPMLSTESGISVSNGIITVPVDTTGSAVSTWLGTAETGKLHAELQGYVSGNQYAQMVVQFDIIIRNRVKR